MDSMFKDRLVDAARNEYFNSLAANEPKASGYALLTQDYTILTASPLTLTEKIEFPDLPNRGAIYLPKSQYTAGDVLRDKLILHFKVTNNGGTLPAEQCIEAFALVTVDTTGELLERFTADKDQISHIIPALVNTTSFRL